MATMISEDTLSVIAAHLEGLTSGDVAVLTADVGIGVDSQGREALLIDLTLPDPVGDTWPVESVLDIRRQLNEYLAAQRFPLGWVVALRSATPTEFDDDDLP
jgi:hypothetical protein